MKHAEQHPQAGQMVTIAKGQLAGSEYRLEDWWDRVAGKSWIDCDGNPACLDYALTSVEDGLPLDDNVVYGKIGRLGKLVHISQLDQ